ncbi:MAG: PH domain-containing protein [Candidatus Sumerlaeia bacterium]|nr:PH domain-containing protein [Candidatus Sumerlaeia bacterium]
MSLIDMLRGNATEADAEKIRKELEPLLVPGEEVERAYRLVRDLIVFTTHRLIFVDKQGVSGTKVEWMSIPYNKVTRFSAETAGLMDFDAEFRVWVGSSEAPIRIEVGRSVPVADLLKVLGSHVLR